MSRYSKAIICCGFTPCVQRMIEFREMSKGSVNRALRVMVGIGGKGANTARMVCQLGGDSLHVGFVGGANGALFERLLKDEGVFFQHIRTEGETRICQTLVEADNPDATELVEEMPRLAADEWGRMVDLLDSLDLSGVVTVSGKLPTGAPEDAYALVVERANRQGGRVILDAQGEPLLRALDQNPFLVKINRDELLHVAEGADALLARGARAVLITDGARLSQYYASDESWVIHPPSVDAVNAVGSGDAVTAGVAVELSRGASMREAVRKGMACGAANALGLVSGSLDGRDVDRLLSAVQFG